MISYLHRGQINEARWDRVLELSGFETVYAHAWYLDACAGNWGALVMGEYEFVMPVAFRKKLGFRYAYQPRFCQQLGIYSENEVSREILLLFLHELKKRFSFGDYAFNEGNLIGEADGFGFTHNSNYTLQLNSAYGELQKGYSSNCKRNVRKAVVAGLEFSDEISISDLVNLKKQHDHHVQQEDHYRRLTEMFSGLEEKGKVKACGVKLEGQLSAGAIFAFSGKRVHYLLSVSSGEGKEKSGMFLVIDRFMKIHAGNAICLDFEGSNIPSIARFFTGFGAVPNQYLRIGLNPLAGKIIKGVKSILDHD
ncbi:MAG: hypothetical protein GY790_07730 [Bacteroidetes bacterium]|nr:hypothetical protein [Bacteroidota bacterium]